MIATVFDPHIWPHKRMGGALSRGINQRGALCLDVLGRTVNAVNAEDAELIVAGDLVDSAGPVQPQFAAALRSTLMRARNGVHLVLGNHDMTADGDHSLGLYESGDPQYHGNVKVIDRIQRWAKLNGNGASWSDPQGQVVLVPFNADLHDAKVRDCPLLIAHFGVYDEGFPVWLRNSTGALHVDKLFAFMEERNVSVALLGDWHTRNVWERRGNTTIHHSSDTNCFSSWQKSPGSRLIMQGGALVPTGFDNAGLSGYGTLALWDGQTLRWRELPGPRFCVVRGAQEEAATVAEAARLGHALFLRRFYGINEERPIKPEGVFGYEALPAQVEQAARSRVKGHAVYRAGMQEVTVQQLISEWLDELRAELDGDEVKVIQELTAGYLK